MERAAQPVLLINLYILVICMLNYKIHCLLAAENLIFMVGGEKNNPSIMVIA